MFKNIATSKDLNFGLKKEKEIKTILESFFKCVLKQLDQYNKMDFVDEINKYFFELKSRRINKNKYDTTFINFCKITEADRLISLDLSTKIYFIFNFSDKLTYIKYDKELFKTFQIKNVYLPFRNCYVKNYEIPVKKLSII